MKLRKNRFTALIPAFFVTFASVHAAPLYWDGGTTDIATDGNGAINGSSGTWDTTIKNWDAGASPHVAWNNANGDTANFGSTTTSTVTLGTSITAGGLIVRQRDLSTNPGLDRPLTMAIGSNTLTVNGDVTVGPNNSTPTRVNLTGATGKFEVNSSGGTFRVGGTSFQGGTLFDMSALGTFTADLGATGKVIVGTETTFNSNAAGQNSALTLAPDSTITAGSLEMGTNQRVATAVSNTLNLGTGTNELNIDNIYMGPNQNSGSSMRGTTATLQFLNSNGTVTLRGAAGGTSRANLNVGNVSGSFSNITAIADFTGHDSDLLVDALTIGKYTAPSASSGSWFSTGTMSFDAGTLDANSVGVGIDSGSNGDATGTLNIGGGTTTIGSGGITIGGSAGGTGTLNFTGGTITMGGAITKVGASTAAALTLDGAILDMAGHAIGGATAIDSVNLLSGTLKDVSQINDGAGLTKTGSGTLILEGTNTYTGLTSVNEGKLIINGANSSTSGVTVEAGATLGGSGSVAGAVLIKDGATLSPGTSPGQLTVNSTLTLAAASNTLMEIGGTTLGGSYDNITISAAGALAYGGNLSVVNFGAYDMDLASLTYNLFSLNGVTPTGDFASVTVNSTSLANSLGVWTGSNAGVSYSFDPSIGDLTVTVVPEPSAALLGALGLLALVRRRR